MSYLWTGVVMTAREVLRGRLVLLLLVLIPTVFYAVAGLTTTVDPIAFQLGSIDEDLVVQVPQRQEAVVFIGLAATGLLTSFIALKLIQRDADVNQRLVLCGYRARELVASKLAVLLVVTLAVALYVAAALPLVFFDVQRFGLLLLGFVMGGWVYGCYGLLVGTILRKELEGILFVALMTNIDSGWLQNPVWYADAQNRFVIKSLPAHFPSQVSMGAAFTDEAVWLPVLGSFLYGLVLLALALAVFAWRMRRR
ncbi:MAG: ABC transporter permease [Deltaproteobacteria bacterium]|nr:ABC transporter permease [Deltaproteobacteria bacterium]